MKKALATVVALLLFPLMLTGQSKVWVSGYYAGWMQDYLLPTDIDFGAVTHIMHFSIEPNNSGGISGTGNGINSTTAAALITPAHAAGVKVLITCGGAGDDGGFLASTNNSNRAKFVSNLVNFAVSNGYDGIDIDWEPITSTSQFRLFIPQLRAAMDSAKPGMLLTLALQDGYDDAVTPVASSFDQINIMTYDLSGAWDGWVTWHNSATTDGGYTFPSTGGPLPSADGCINTAIDAGIPKNQLGIGTDFYGYVWTGVSRPRQSWTSAPDVTGNIAYYDLMKTYGSNPVLWDTSAGAAYMSITSGGQKFVSLDNEQTMAAKAQYIRTKGIGGIIIWELGGGYQDSAPAGQRDKLLQAVKQSFMLTGIASKSATPSEFRLEQNFPNPFNPTTTVEYSLASTENVSLRVYDIIGRQVAELVSGVKSAGTHRAAFNATGMASGVYFYRLTAGNSEITKSMILLK